MNKAPNRVPPFTGGTRPKLPAWPSTTQFQLRPEAPDPVSHPWRWIHVEMLKIPHVPWWKSLMSSGKMMMFSHILHESLNKPEALQMVHWQAAVFQLPQAHQKAAGWLAPLLTIPALNLRDYIPSPTSTDCWVRRQQEAMPLARALQPVPKSQDSPWESSVMQCKNYKGAWLPC